MNDASAAPRAFFGPWRSSRKAVWAITMLLISVGSLPAAPGLVSGVDISRWRGFNLLEHYTVGRETNFKENDFKVMARDRFNFARLPLDYAIYEETNTPGTWRPAGLAQLDEAVALGRKYKVHVCLNLHKAPGYCVNLNAKRPELQDQLWTNQGVQDQCIATWVMLAKRYQAVPATDLSFNLLNEPHRVAASNFIPLMKRMVAAIHAVHPSRIIVMDGMNVGSVPQEELYRLPNVVTAIRGYAPGTLTHYKAEWVRGSDKFPLPVWPAQPSIYAYHFGPEKEGVQRAPAVLEGPFPPGTRFEVTVEQVSRSAEFLVRGDGNTLLAKSFNPGPGAGEWKEVIFKNGMYQNRYDLTLPIVLTNGCRTVSLEITNGDWLRVSALNVRFPRGGSAVIGVDTEWGRSGRTLVVGETGTVLASNWTGTEAVTKFLDPWKVAQTNGAVLFVGEMGVYKHTPHDVTLRWFETCLKEYRAMNIGWALWNFRGTMGVADSERTDASYENRDGMKVDVKMMDLLKTYLPKTP